MNNLNTTTATFGNPLVPDANSPDPWMVYHDGFYYLTYTCQTHLSVTKARSIADLAHSEPTEVWRDETPSRCDMIWAPEFYLLDGPNGRRWYLYYTASDCEIDKNHRMHVLESQGDTPLGPYEYKGSLRTDPEHALYAIDGSILKKRDGEMYFLWAGHPDHRLFISRMENPWTLTGERVLIEADGFGCEEVREGPVCLQNDGKIFLIYSACDTGKPDYKLGMLIAEESADVLNPASWTQHPEPVFTRCDANGAYGPGHNGFFQSPDGSENWIIYHAKTTKEYTYEGRTARAQKFTWNADGTPHFGAPLSLDEEVSLPSGDPGPSRYTDLKTL